MIQWVNYLVNNNFNKIICVNIDMWWKTHHIENIQSLEIRILKAVFPNREMPIGPEAFLELLVYLGYSPCIWCPH